MIYITGDTHGTIDFSKLKAYFKKKYVSRKDYLIILGDAGIVWDSDYKNTVGLYESLGLTIYYIDGNHENFDLLESFPIISSNNAKVHRISEYIFHVLRGEILILNGLSFLCIGGAESIDKTYRKPGVSWWKQERINENDINNALSNLSSNNMEVDYVLTHCVSDNICIRKFGYDGDESTRQLSRLCSYVKTKHWFFGHYHFDEIIDSTFRCFYQDIIEIDKKDEGKRNIDYKLLIRSSIFDDNKHYPFLINRDTGRKTKLIEEDLPEWYFHNFSYRDWYYCVKDVKDVAYIGSPFDNHISKDSSIFLSYDGLIEKDEEYKPIDRFYSNYVHTWRCNVVSFVYALEKYSPNLDLTKLKERINLTYDQYNRNENNWYRSIYTRPFPEINTMKIKGIKYSAVYDYDTLCDFYELDNAKKFCEFYLRSNLDVKKYQIIEKRNYIIYEFLDKQKEIKKIRIMKYEQ